jgi:hypothetical protein
MQRISNSHLAVTLHSTLYIPSYSQCLGIKVEVKGDKVNLPLSIRWRHIEKVEIWLHLFEALAVVGGEWLALRLGPCILRKCFGTHLIRWQVGPQPVRMYWRQENSLFAPVILVPDRSVLSVTQCFPNFSTSRYP